MSAASPFLATDASVDTSPSPFELFEDRRIVERYQRAVMVHLLRDDGALMGPCLTDNVSLHGMHVTVPVGYGVAVGQRWEVRIGNADGPPSNHAEAAYATVVRTRMATDGERHRVQVGLRLDQPVFLFT